MSNAEYLDYLLRAWCDHIDSVPFPEFQAPDPSNTNKEGPSQ